MKRIVLIASMSFLLGLFLAGMIFVYIPEKNSTDNFLQESPQGSTLSSNLYASPLPQRSNDLDFATIAQNIGPAVVRIEADRVEKRRGFGNGDDSFDDLWDKFFGTPRRKKREQEYRTRAQGTGFFISQDGYIITNNHIVENAEKVIVNSLDGREYKAEIIGTDSKTDIALIKVNSKNETFAKLGDSGELMVGEWVLAIGNPMGLEHTVTAGIVSAKGRQIGGIMGDVPYQDFIQTDAAINKGNSGGPLVNMRGEVIGITSMILSTTGGNMGIGLAIPSTLVTKIVKQLKEDGRVVRGYLGVGIYPYPITDDMIELFNLKSKKGALISSVEEGEAAEKAGLKRYDVITNINGELVEDNNDLRFKIADIKPRTKIDLTIVRDGEEKSLTVKVGELDPPEEKESTPEQGKDIGITVDELTPRMARRYGFRTQTGVVITEVRNYSEAERQNLRAGDIVLEANRRKIKNPKDLRKVINDARAGDRILLLIRREFRGSDTEPQEFLVTIRIPE